MPNSIKLFIEQAFCVNHRTNQHAIFILRVVEEWVVEDEQPIPYDLMILISHLMIYGKCVTSSKHKMKLKTH